MKVKALANVRELPEAKKLIEKRLIDMDFIKRKGNDFIQVIMEEATQK